MIRYKVTPSICWAVLLLLMAAASAQADTLRVKLALTPDETLPGIPVTVDLRISNATAKDIVISSRVVIAVTSITGNTDRLAMDLPKQYWNGEIDQSWKYIVPAGGEIRLFMPVTEDLDSPLFAENQITMPGDYDLVATVKGTGNASGDSNSVHLRVSTPSGDDAAYWELSRGDISDVVVRASCATITKYPLSRYYRLVSPFCVPFVTLDQYSHDVLQSVPSLPGAFQDAARLAVAHQYLSAASTAYGQNKLTLAGSISDAGRPIAQDLIDHPGTSFGPVAGAWMKTALGSEADWRAWYSRSHTATPTVRLTPSVTCVTDNGDGTFSADFGFTNPNDEYIEIAIGPDNHLSPGPDNQGQPTDFKPWTQASVFTIKGLTAPVIWTLQGKTAKASRGQSPNCADLQPPDPEP